MNTIQTFTPNITSKECVEILRHEGALWLQGFVQKDEQDAITSEVFSHTLTEVDRSKHPVPEQFQEIGWHFHHAPEAVTQLGKRIARLIHPELPQWHINSVRAQLYSPGEVGIEWHRDYKRDLRVIAVASFISKATFDVELDSGQQTWELEPGDLVLMRGSLLNGRIDDRPRHRARAPKQDQRLSVAYRQVVKEVPKLEPRK